MTEGQQPINVYQPSDRAFFVGLLEHDDFLEKFEHFLRGEVLTTTPTADKKSIIEEWQQRYPAKMNSYGVNEVMSTLRPICESKIIAVTEFDEKFIDKLGYINVQTFTELLTENYDNFDFKSISALDSVLVSGITIIMAQLKRAHKGSTLDAITTNTSVSEQRQIIQPEQKEGVLSRLPGFGKKEAQFKV